MLQYTSELEPWQGGVSSYLRHRLAGITLVKALCFACLAVKRSRGSRSFCAAKSACAPSLAGKRGERRGSAQTPAFLAPGFRLGGRGRFLPAWFLPRRDIAFAHCFLPTVLQERLSPGTPQRAAGSCQSCTAAGLSHGSPCPGLSPSADLGAMGPELLVPL